MLRDTKSHCQKIQMVGSNDDDNNMLLGANQ